MMQKEKNNMKAVLIEPDMNDQPPAKKQKTCAQNELAEALLELRKPSIPHSRPLLHPSTFSSFPTDSPKTVRPHRGVSDVYTAISDDEEERPVMACLKYADRLKKGADSNHSGRPSSMFTFPLGQHLPLGRPLPPAPHFPRLAPGLQLWGH